MSKLALRIFVSFFVALMVTGVGTITVTSWLIAERKEAAAADLLVAAQEAANALADGGVSSLRAWAERRSVESSVSLDVLIIDENGKDLLGRTRPNSSPEFPAATDDVFAYDFPAVFLNLPTESPELISDEGEVFRLIAVNPRTGFGVLRDIPVPLLTLSFFVTALVSFLLARSITRPIIELQKTTEDLAIGKLDSRVSKTAQSRRDEIGQLARSLNSMANQISSLIKGQQQLLRDISHEVRSPLTRIRLASGLLAQRDAAAATTAARIDGEIARLDELIDKILDVSRLESGAVSWRPEPLELCSILERVLADAGFEAEQLGKVLSSRLPDSPLDIVGDRHWIQSAVENVIRNALKHTPHGASVEILVDEHERFARVRVRDSGAGLPVEDLAKIFEPFYRSAANGSERTDTSTGLGLAIAAQVIRGHRGRIEARNLSHEGFRSSGFEVCMQWPLKEKTITDSRTAIAP
ncbi:MAG: ATP-binding protein [Gammaproteobacteria bacterium]